MKIWIVHYANPFEWQIVAVYTSEEKLVKGMSESWEEDLSIETLLDYDWQRKNDVKIVESEITE